jgi:hypothetical protein
MRGVTPYLAKFFWLFGAPQLRQFSTRFPHRYSATQAAPEVFPVQVILTVHFRLDPEIALNMMLITS